MSLKKGDEVLIKGEVYRVNRCGENDWFEIKLRDGSIVPCCYGNIVETKEEADKEEQVELLVPINIVYAFDVLIKAKNYGEIIKIADIIVSTAKPISHIDVGQYGEASFEDIKIDYDLAQERLLEVEKKLGLDNTRE